MAVSERARASERAEGRREGARRYVGRRPLLLQVRWPPRRRAGDVGCLMACLGLPLSFAVCLFHLPSLPPSTPTLLQ